MSNQDGRVIINIDSNASKAQREFEALDVTTSKYNQTLKNTQNTANSSKSALSSYGNQLKANKTSAGGFDNALGSLSGSLGSLKGLTVAAAAGFAAMKLKDYGQYALQTAASFEQLAISFRVMTGSAQTGQELTDAIIKLGAETPMTAQQLSKTAQLLLSFGESAENIIPDLKLLGDITGGEVNRFNMLALAFAQVGANGKLMGQDLLQMVNAGFNPLQIMSQTTGKSMGELRKEMEEGRISFQMVAQAMRDAASEGGRYFGLMEQQSQSLNGLLSTMGDVWEQVAKNIGDLFLPVAKSAVQGLISLGEAVLNLQNKMKAFTAGLRHETADSNNALAEGLRKQAAHLQEVAKDYEQRGNANWAASYRKKAQQFLDEATRLQQKAQQIEKNTQKSVLSQSGANTGFNATVLSSGDDEKGRKKRQLTISEKLQKSYNDEYRRLQDLATQGITSGKVWDSQVAKVNNLSAALERVKQATDLSVVPPFQALNTEIQKAQERVNNLAASKIVNLADLRQAKSELTSLQKRLYDVQQAATTSPYQQKQNQVNYLQGQLQDMVISGQQNSPGFNALKNQLREAQNEITRANTAVSNSVGLTWNNISSTISTQLSSALTTPLQEGENAFERLGNVALNIIGQIAQAWLSSSLMNFFNGSSGGKGLGTRFGNAAKGAAAGSAGGIWGAVGGAISGFFNANGNAFSHGRVLPFAQGGVVSGPTMFPMAGNRTGIMGEKGAEAIMPLKRAPNGQLGVQAQTAPATVNIYNQSDSRIETVQRPDGETDIFIRRVNNALRNERTQAGFSSALQRNQSRGVQAS